MPVAVASFGCWLLFGLGLLLSGMTQPAKVLGFLDVLGQWDPTLAFVMAGAMLVSSIGFTLVRRRSAPLWAPQSLWPTRTDVDRPLLIGAVMFGAGWGLLGLCPGPALENLVTLSPPVIVFVLAMAFGMVLQDVWQRRVPAAGEIENAALATSVDG
jgi:uncharacterized membrane protein YedE/YeeE